MDLRSELGDNSLLLIDSLYRFFGKEHAGTLHRPGSNKIHRTKMEMRRSVGDVVVGVEALRGCALLLGDEKRRSMLGLSREVRSSLQAL